MLVRAFLAAGEARERVARRAAERLRDLRRAGAGEVGEEHAVHGELGELVRVLRELEHPELARAELREVANPQAESRMVRVDLSRQRRSNAADHEILPKE